MRNILIKSVHVACPDAAASLRPAPVDVLVRNGRIAAIEADIAAPDAMVIDGRGGIATAGFVDSHRHIWQTAIRGVAADWSLVDYVREIRVGYATAFSPEHVYLANLIGALEALDTGVTTVCDYSHIMNSPAHTEAAVQGLTDAGIRGAFCYGFYDVPTRGRVFADHAARLAHAAEMARAFTSSAGSRLRFGLALTEFGLATPQQTDAEIDIARRYDALITLHVGTFGSPHGIADLDRRGRLGPDMLHVHANLCNDRELARLVESGGGLSITPETEMQMGMGFPVTNRLLSAGGMPSFGVDIVSQNSGDMLSQIRLGLQTARAIDNEAVLETGASPEKVRLTVRDALRFGTEGGAVAMGYGSEIGHLRPGAAADIAVFGTQGLNMSPMSDPVSMLVLQARPGDAHTVLVDGQIMKQDGRLIGHDLDALRARMQAAFVEIVDQVGESKNPEAATAGAYARVIAGAMQTK